MQNPGNYDNPGFQDGYPGEKQDQSNPPPPYYPSAPGPLAPGPPAHAPAPYYQPYYPTAPMPPPQQPLICQQSTNVVVVNPHSVVIRPRQNDYLCWSICNFLCCCWPLGIVAMIFSCKTRSDNDNQNQEAAICSSKTALALNITSLIVGIIMYIIIAVVYFQRYS